MGLSKSRIDTRKYKERLVIAVFPLFLSVFLFFFFMPLDVFLNNMSDFELGVKNVFTPMLLTSLAFFIISSLLLPLIKGKAFDWLVCLVLGGSLAAYIQKMILNLNLGLLDGSKIDWGVQATYGIVNLLIWLVIIALPFLAYYLIKKHWIKAVRLCSILLIGMQLVSFIFMVITGEEKTKYYLSGEEQYTVSQDKNVVVFILDHFSNSYIDQMLKEYPDALDAFEDFKYYTNVNSRYCPTYPSVNYILTGAHVDFSISEAEWNEQSWVSESATAFYDQLESKDYKTNVFSYYDIAEHSQNMSDKVSNYKLMDDFDMNNVWLVKRMTKLSFYTSFPQLFKRFFVIETKDFTQATGLYTYKDGIKDQPEYYTALVQNRLSADDRSNYFIVQHLWGAHRIHNIDENALPLYDASLEQAARGCFVMVQEYINQMKQLGVYEDATIIIMSDHGCVENSTVIHTPDDGNIMDAPQVFYFVKEPNAKHHGAVSSAPVSHEELHATIAYNIGADTQKLGRTIYDIGEDEQRERTFSYRIYDSSDYHNYVYVGNEETLVEHLANEPSETIIRD